MKFYQLFLFSILLFSVNIIRSSDFSKTFAVSVFASCITSGAGITHSYANYQMNKFREDCQLKPYIKCIENDKEWLSIPTPAGRRNILLNLGKLYHERINDTIINYFFQSKLNRIYSFLLHNQQLTFAELEELRQNMIGCIKVKNQWVFAPCILPLVLLGNHTILEK